MEQRRGYHFDPTVNEALAHITRQEKHPVNLRPMVSNIYHATGEDMARLQEHIFEPDLLRGRSHFRREMRRTLEVRKQQKGGI